jgi:hypothetical protein
MSSYMSREGVRQPFVAARKFASQLRMVNTSLLWFAWEEVPSLVEVPAVRRLSGCTSVQGPASERCTSLSVDRRAWVLA